MYKKHTFYLTILLIFVVSATQVTAQSPRRILREANQLIEVELYREAIDQLEPLTEKNHPEALLLKGFSVMSREENFPNAIEILQKAAELHPLEQENNSEQTLEAHFYLGQAYRMNGDAKKAIEKFSSLKKHTSLPEVVQQIDREIEYCQTFLKAKENPAEMDVEHLGEVLNSPYEDHSPVVLYDESTLYFTSNRPLDTLDTDSPYFENIFVSNWRNGQWSQPKILDIPGDPQANRATIGLTPDGQGLIIFQNDGYSGSLYIARKTFDGWAEPEPLPAPINSNYNETHASFSPDGNTLFFSSERPGGLGGKDIYYSNKLPDGKWANPVNMGENINTPMDEESPFLHPDGETLYFSSSGHNSMGGYDIFVSKNDENDGWSQAENIGYPINTPADDIFYIPTPDGQRVYYASRRDESLGQTDLFVLHFPETHQRSMAVVASHVFDSKNQPAEAATIRVKDQLTNEQTGVYRINPSTGKFVAIIPTGRQYIIEVAHEGHQTYSHTFKLSPKDDYKSKSRAIYLPAITLKKEASSDQ